METETKKQILKKQFFYRGLIKSCNYSCEYCPFSKHISQKELEKDSIELGRFVDFMEKNQLNAGAVQITPYGEALIHEYYWRAMAALSRIPTIDLVGCQTNLSFPVKRMLNVFEKAGGYKEKLRLWCTFHPSMVSQEKFLEQCSMLDEEKVSYCVGSVGVPENKEILMQLREKLLDDVYMWVNPMDGMGRLYTQDEIEAFKNIDIFFPYLLKRKKSQPKQCKGCQGDSLFIHSNGDITPCNISKKKLGNIYEFEDLNKQPLNENKEYKEVEKCGQRECSCFLAYSNRLDYPELVCYGKYPAFRIPKIPKAMFLDVDGTLIKEGQDSIDTKVAEEIAYWSQYTKIYLATSLPYIHAMKKCRNITNFLSGGVFANGGMTYLFKEKKQHIISIESEDVDFVKRFLKKYSIKVKVYQHEGKVYKITGIGKQTTQAYKELQKLINDQEKEKQLSLVLEDEHLQIMGKQANKLSSVQSICDYYNYMRDEVLVAGNSENDKAMLEYFSLSICCR